MKTKLLLALLAVILAAYATYATFAPSTVNEIKFHTNGDDILIKNVEKEQIISLSLDNKVICEIQPSADTYSFVIFGSGQDVFHVVFEKKAIQPVSVIRAISINDSKFLIVYDQKGEIQKKVEIKPMSEAQPMNKNEPTSQP